MKGTEYKKFIYFSKEALKKGRKENKNTIGTADKTFLNLEAFKKYSYQLQIKKLNNFTDHLNGFENQAKKRSIKVLWAVNYQEVLEELKKIKKTYDIKNIWHQKEDIFEEIGMRHFLKEENIQFSTVEKSDALIYQANGLIEESGSLYLEFNEKSFLESIYLSKPKIFFTGIENIFPSLQEVELYRSVYTLYKHKKKSPVYSLVYSPFREPVKSAVIVMIIDNGRSNLIEDTEIRKVLTCIHCGACSEVCPVAKRIGREPYNNVFSGPIANIILPYLENVEDYQYLCHACTLCGSCERICPMHIPLTDLILKNKNQFSKKSGKLYNYLSGRKKMNTAAWIKNRIILINLSSDFKRNRKLRKIQKKTFNQLWTVQNKNQQNV